MKPLDLDAIRARCENAFDAKWATNPAISSSLADIPALLDALDEAQRPVSDMRVAGAISLVRSAWRDDGAEGESVHLLADAAEQLTRERDEARVWVRRLTAAERVLTCAFCGEAYPPGTPDANHERLTGHVFLCKKHPIRGFIEEAIEVTCGPADVLKTPSEDAFAALDDVITNLLSDVYARPAVRTRFDVLRAAVWSALADEIKPLHELVKAAGACVCPKEADHG